MGRWWLAAALLGVAGLAAAVLIRTRGDHGVRMVYTCDDCTRASAIVRARLADLGTTATVTAHGSQLSVEIRDRVERERVAQIEDVLARRAKLEIKLVDDGSPYMKQVESKLREQPANDVTAASEDWRAPTGSLHHDVFVRGHEHPQIARYFEGIAAADPMLRVPLDRELGFGRDGDGWRSYFLVRTVLLDGSGISTTSASARGVQLGLDPRATRQLGMLTSSHLGRKLAIEIDGVIYAAPVVTAPIMNGNLEITLGDPRERDELAIALRSGAAPALELSSVETF